MSVWKSVAQQIGGLAKHVATQVVHEPVEVVENAVGTSAKPNENQGMKAMEQGAQTQQNSAGDDPNQPKGFKTQDDFLKYQQLSGHKDEMELAMLRKRLFQENGLDVSIDSGMQKARMEFAQKEEERKKVVEQKKQEEKWVIEQKKQEDIALKAAKQASSAENKAWGAG